MPTDAPSHSKTRPVLAVVGLAGTGKSMVSARLADRHGFRGVYFGGAVISEVKRRGLDVTQENERAVREELRASMGMDAIAKLLAPDIARLVEENTSPVAIDGLYSQAEYEYLTGTSKLPILLLAVHSPRALRYERLAARPYRPLQPKAVDDRDHMELRRLDKALPIVLADFHIVNDGELEELFAAVDAIVARI